MSTQVTMRPFGTLPDGRSVDSFELSNAGGMRVVILTYGAIVQAIEVPDRYGRTANVTLGYETLDEYVAGGAYFGAIVGRYANRIANARFDLDGETVQLAANWRGHHLHGGHEGLDRRLWTARATPAGVLLSYTSPDGEEGYPGRLEAELSYVLTEPGGLRIDYRAATDAPTVINLTNHAYFNLNGEGSGSVDGHVLEVNARHYTPVHDADLIPTGEIASVANTPLDFRTPTAIGARIRHAHEQLLVAGGYDHNYVLAREGDGLVLAARVSAPESGRLMTVHTTQPGVQFYSGNQLNGTVAGPSGRSYRQGDAFALETQHFPDAPNQPSFPSTVLRPGELYATTTVYAFDWSG